MNPNIFRAYDIRGAADTDLESSVVLKIGKALATLCQQDGVVELIVGRDTRPSSSRISEALVHSLITSGLTVHNMGITTSPGLYWATANRGVDTGVMITGSHNSWDQNGLKIIYRGQVLPPEGIVKLGELAKLDYPWSTGSGKEMQAPSFFEAYREFLQSTFNRRISAKVVFDLNCGPANLLIPELTKAKGIDAVLIRAQAPDQGVVNPDPSGENLRELVRAVRDEGAHYGVAFDGDADRVVVVDRTGRVFDGEETLAMLSRSFLEEEPGATVLSDVKASRRLIRKIEQLGGKCELWKTGHSFIKSRMSETGIKLAGENSGHMYFGDNHNFDDAVYAACKLIDSLDKAGQTPAEYLGDLQEMVTEPVAKIAIADDIKFQVVERTRDRLAEMGYTVNDIDGARVETPKAWGLIRASNTEACITTRFEAEDMESLQELKKVMLETLEWAGSGAD